MSTQPGLMNKACNTHHYAAMYSWYVMLHSFSCTSPCTFCEALFSEASCRQLPSAGRAIVQDLQAGSCTCSRDSVQYSAVWVWVSLFSGRGTVQLYWIQTAFTHLSHSHWMHMLEYDCVNLLYSWNQLYGKTHHCHTDQGFTVLQLVNDHVTGFIKDREFSIPLAKSNKSPQSWRNSTILE